MNEFLRFTDINTASVSTAVVLTAVFFYLGYKASGNTEQVYRILWSA